MSTATLSRRSLAKGAAWTVPAIAFAAAAPALATSTNPAYNFAESHSVTYSESSNAMTAFAVSTSLPTTLDDGTLASGFAVTAADSTTPTTTATLESLTMTVSIESGHLTESSTYSWTTQGGWSDPVISDDGTTTTITFTWDTASATTSAPTQAYLTSGVTDSAWPGSAMSISFSGFGTDYTDTTLAVTVSYSGSFTMANGASKTVNTTKTSEMTPTQA